MIHTNELPVDNMIISLISESVVAVGNSFLRSIEHIAQPP